MISRAIIVAPGLATLRYRRTAAALLLIGLALCLWALPSLRFDNDIQRGFLSDSPRSQVYRDFVGDMGGSPQVAVLLIEANQPFSAKDYEAIRDLALDLEFADRVEAVLSLFSARFPKTHALYPGEAVVPAEIDLDDLDARFTAYTAMAPPVRLPLTADRTTTLIVAPLSPKSTEAKTSESRTDETGESVSEILQTHPLPGLRMTLTGEAAIAADMVDNLKQEMIVLNTIGTALSFGLAILLLGSLRAALVVFLPAVAGALMSMGLFMALQYPITLLNVIIPVLILLLGAADGFHLVMHLGKQDNAKPWSDRLKTTLLDVGPANALTSLTTAIGFGAVSVSQFDQLDELALLGALGVGLSYLVLLVAFTLLAPLLKTPPHQQTASPGASLGPWLSNLLQALWSGAAAFCYRHSARSTRIILILSLLLTALGTWSYMETRAWFPLYQNLPDNSEVRRANRIIEDEFGGFFRIWTTVDLSDDTGWQRLRDVTEAIRSEAPAQSVVSLTTLVDWLGLEDRLPDKDALADVPDGLMAQLLTPDRQTARVVTFVPEPMHDLESLNRHDRIEHAAFQAGADSNIGFPVILRHDALMVVSQLGNGLIAACLIASLVVAAAFRRPGLTICLLLPNILPLLIAAMLVHVMNAGQLNPPSVLALTVAFGIAIDDAIHFTNRYLLERRAGHDLDTALRLTISDTGWVMTATTLTICIGLTATQFSPFGTVRLFGAMMAVTFLIALLADLLLLPALLRKKWTH